MSRRPSILLPILIGISAGLGVIGATTAMTAREIDNEQTVSTEQIKLGQALPKTLVVRTKVGTHESEVLHLNQVLPPDEKSHHLVSTGSFIKVDSNGKMIGELDRDSSRSSWAFVLARGGFGRAGGVGGYRPGGYRPGGYRPGGYRVGGYRAGGYYGGYRYGRYYGYGGRYYGYGRYYAGYGRYYGRYGYPYGGGYDSYYDPSYSYGGYDYPYSPYYSYNDNGYDYDYYGWPQSNPYAVSVSY